MALAKNTVIFNLSNPNFNLSSGVSNKLPRLCFTSLPKHSRVIKCKSASRNPAERNNGNEDRRWIEEEENPEPTSETKEKANENGQKGKRREGVKSETEKVKERAMEGTHKAVQTAEAAKEKTGEGTQKAEEALRNVKESTKQKAVWVKEKTDGAAETTADTAKDGAVKVTDTVHKMGKKAKNAMKDVWGTAKETTHKIKETVLGSDEQVDGDEDDDVVMLDNPKREEEMNDAKKKDFEEELGQNKRSGKSDKKN